MGGGGMNYRADTPHTPHSARAEGDGGAVRSDRIGPPRVLSIAGTDPTGGAGIQADLKSIAANGGYGMSAVTALVAQNTQGVRRIHAPEPDFLAAQLDAVSDDVTIDAVKIGMLFDEGIIDVVTRWLGRVRPPIVVLDPVMVATSGDRLLDSRAELALTRLLSHADLVTPNVPELAVLTGTEPATTWDGVLDQAQTLADRHGVRVLAKGGHLEGPVVRDALVAVVEEPHVFESARVQTRNTHGTGCSLSAAIATLQVRRGRWDHAVEEARQWLGASLRGADALAVGRGHGPISHFAELWETGGIRGGRALTAEQVRSAWWDGVADVREEIDDLDFVRALSDGSLSGEQFRWYLEQDALYLREYSRALAHASALATEPAEQAFWARSAHGAIAAEIELHGRWLPADEMFSASAGPVTSAYVDSLLAHAARGDYPALCAALLPCFWVYSDVGERMLAQQSSQHEYSPWIETYADPEFSVATDGAIDVVTRIAVGADASTRERMRAAFEASVRHERDFFAAPMVAVPRTGDSDELGSAEASTRAESPSSAVHPHLVHWGPE